LPQGVPSAAAPPGVQTGEPVPQLIAACWHEPASAQLEPCAQLAQEPSLQTPASHGEPFDAVPDCLQTVCPFTHSVAPLWHAPRLHATPGTHDAASPSAPASVPPSCGGVVVSGPVSADASLGVVASSPIAFSSGIGGSAATQ
jgi:hypothetical protein